MKKKYTFIDLFAGAGGLSEGFVRAGFSPIAHIEMDKYACETLKTRAAYHYLEETGKLDIYKKYLLEKKEGENGQKLWDQVPTSIIDSVIHATIGSSTIDEMQMHVQNASEHGVLQKRQRVIIVGWRKESVNTKGQKRFYPILEKNSNSYCVMKDLFSDLPERKAGEGSLTAIVPYSKELNDMPYLKESAIRNNVFDFTTQHIARPHNANDREIRGSLWVA